MKYAVINCYSDNNKGDLGIILSTIDFLKKADSNANVIGVSTYNYSDPLYKTEHHLLSKEIIVFPAIFGELNLGVKKDNISKFVRFLFDSFRLFFCIIFPLRVNRLLFSQNEKKTFDEVLGCDYIISKGGSFLCNEDNVRSKIAFIRLSFFYILLVKYKLLRKTVILCQSLGPMHGILCKKILNFILNRCRKIVLRESVCIQEYPYIKLPINNIYILNDIAFHLTSMTCNSIQFCSDTIKVGVTIKFINFTDNEKYKTMIKDVIEHSIEKYNAHIYVFPHVTIENDIEASICVYRMIEDKYKSRVTILTNNYHCRELKYLYSKMDIFVATRLHSAIFAMGEYVPAICIAYHGTKAQGIFRNLSSDKYVMVNYDSIKLIELIDEIYTNRIEQSVLLKRIILTQEYYFLDLFRVIFLNEIS